MQHVRCELIERIVERGRIGDQQRGLAEIVQHQRGKRDCEPCEPDRHPAEMSHVGIHGFATGHREKRRAKNGETDVEILMDQEIERIERAYRDQYARRFDDAVDAEQGEHQKPRQHHRPENPADEARALLLHQEKPDQDDDGQRHHGGRQRRRVDLQALDRR